ncbi:ACT domain-containing protein [Calditerrivibrio nitroreducens]|uniref:ACT domain protein n=1 Tax=Calditerrivibrio nitroreducens (strain DSM 19672 / NBRC 101217 / Yu37-1) TaxID=768670 RepID=E4THA7_CALNY|nr:ACT domain-containing protein [Calditerrivibrio nitroreducens]ADR18801.1 ACT domain protein [Calditerrivibrio nitroreducens DSM 19672]
MKITQISVFIENKSGRLYEICDLLGRNNLNIRALSLADTSDFGILRLIVNDPEKAFTLLKQNGFTVGKTEVIAVEVPDVPGGLASVLKVLSANDVNVEYMYAFVEKSSDFAVMIFRFDEVDKALDALEKNGIKTIEGVKIYGI